MTTTASTPQRSERDRLIEDHLDYVRTLATRVKAEVGGTVELDDLVAYGHRGLVEAADRFDPTRGVVFTTFSYYRIRGAIFDGLREIGRLKRNHDLRAHAGANALLENLSERQPSPMRSSTVEAAVADIGNVLDQIATIFVVSHQALHAPDATLDHQRTPEATLAQHETRRVVREAMAKLPERERQLLELHYDRGLSLAAAGRQLGMSKSWASRLHARAIAQLTEDLGPTFGALSTSD